MSEHLENAATSQSGDSAESVIDAWLNLMLRLAHLPVAESRDIREELEEHLHSRTRELILDGLEEAPAARLAITELGDAAVVASRFRHATRSTARSRIMNILIGTTACAGLVLGIATLRDRPGDHTRDPAIFEPAAAEVAGPTIQNLALTNVTLAEAIRGIDDMVPQDLAVAWGAIEAEGIGLDTQVTLAISHPATLDGALHRLFAEMPGVDWRIHDEVVEISTRRAFDRREMVLASFDIGDVVRHISNVEDSTYEPAVLTLKKLIFDSVEPEAWRDNGGDTANLNVVGSKLFVQAPPRFHEPIRWILEQLEPPAQTASGRDFGLERLQLRAESARTAFEHAKKLHDDGFVSDGDLRAAEEAMKNAMIDLDEYVAGRTDVDVPLLKDVPLVGRSPTRGDSPELTR